jgi:eukaryotic-like serine/threonine-protein kinase
MPANLLKARELFLHAVGKLSPEQWESYVVEACGGDAELEQQVRHMLRVHREAGSFLERPAALGGTVASPPPIEGTAAHPTSDDAPGTVIGPYKLLQELGEGGMGAVFMAEQTHPVQRKVALKLIKAGMDSKSVLARFEAERQALALMDHPNIARVFDAGTTDRGSPYFVMELVKGVPITKYCDDHHLTCEERLGLFVRVCQAVQHAHQKGIIHRDIKPTNVMVCLYDGQPVPKVIDFGVAKATGQKLTDKTLFTEVGAVVGTLQYMSPEQAEVNQLDVDTRSDVYSLGVLLYELLTGTTPLERNRLKEVTFLEVLRLIREEEPPRPSTRLSTAQGLPAIAANRGLEPRRLNGVVRGELDWISMRALEKDRARRYETASAFAADVERYLNDESVQACPPSALYRFRKFARRNKPALVTATAAVLAVLTAVAGLATSNFLIAREQEETRIALRTATEARDDLKQANERERVEAYYRRIALAYSALSVNNLGGALKLLEDCPEDLRGWEWRYLMRLCRVEPLVIRDKTGVHSVAFSSDGERLASASGDGTVKVWNSRTGKVIQTIPAHKGFASSVAFHPDGDHLISVGADKLVKVWYLAADPFPRKVFEHPCDAVHMFGTAYAAAFSPLDHNHLAVGCEGAVRVWNWRTEKPVHTFPGQGNHRLSLAFSRDGKRLASGNWRGSVNLWNPEAGGESLRTFPETRHAIAALAFSPDSERLAAACFGRRVDVWETATGKRLRSLSQSGLVLGVAFSPDPDGRLIVSVGEDKIVHVWDAASGRELLGLRGHAGVCGCVVFSPDGQRLASASVDGTIRIWDATPLRGDERQESAPDFTEHGVEVWSLAVSPDGKRIVSGAFGPPVMIWEVPSAKPEGFAKTKQVSARFSDHDSVVFCTAWHPDGRRVAFAGANGDQFTVKVKVLDARKEQDNFALPLGAEYFAVAFSPDGKYLVTGNGERLVQVWDAATGQPVQTLGTHKGVIRGVAFSPDHDHKYLASVSSDGEVKLWDATRLGEKDKPRDPIRTFPAHSPGVGLNIAFSPDGTRLVTGGKEHTVTIWDVETRKLLHTLRGHNGDVSTVAFSPDGRWVVSGGEDSTVKVWDSRTGDLLRSFRGHTGLVSTVAFLDDRTLITGSRDHRIKFWDLTHLEQP